MSQTDNSKVDAWMNRTVVDATGNKVGTVTDIYLDEETKQPDWLAVSTGLFGTKVSFVPIEGARLDGDDLVVAYDKDMVKDAPRIDADGMLSIEDEQSLFAYYGRAYTPHTGSDAPVVTTDAPATGPASDAPVSMVRSEEELSIGKHSREAGRVKLLRKWVETENVQVTVPVERQMARVVREPVSGSDTSAVGDFVEGEEEIVLSEEVVDVAKRVVAKERVGLETDTVTEQVPVNETVRKERVDVDGDIDGVTDRGNTMIGAVKWSDGIQSAWNDLVRFVPRLIGFLLVLVIGYLIAKAISKALNAILERVGFDRAVERGGVRKALAQSKYDASDIVAKLIFYALFLLVLQMAFGVFGPNPISDLIRSVIAYLPRVIVAIIIVVVASAIGAAIRELIDASLGGLSYGKTLATAAGTAVLVIGLFAALNELLIAPAIVTGLFYALLAIIVGSAVIAIGGGGIQPMRERWTKVLDKYDEEKPKVQEAAQGAKDRIKQRTQQRLQQATPNESSNGTSVSASSKQS